jgi:Cysteine rich repeat
MRVLRSGMLVALALAFGAGVASAQQHQGHDVCKADVQKFCKDVQPGGGKVAKCLAQHDADLSAPCKEGIAKMRERVKVVTAACQTDMQQLCKGVEPGGGRIAHCLKENDSKLSQGCRSAIQHKG